MGAREKRLRFQLQGSHNRFKSSDNHQDTDHSPSHSRRHKGGPENSLMGKEQGAKSRVNKCRGQSELTAEQ